jgi:SagB-type dehydrogenase family enzyme
MGMTLMASAQDIKLPKPLMENKVTLMEALQNRHSSREYSEKQITDSELSTVLWAACGINRPESGKLTVPSAINAQDILAYVIRQDGAYLYQAKENTLKKVNSKDLRTLVAGRQAFAATAPVSLVLVSDHSKFGKARNAAERLGVIDAGYVSQNICLACSALGLNTVPRMTMDTEGLRKELGLDSNYDIIINSQIGYPKTSEK